MHSIQWDKLRLKISGDMSKTMETLINITEYVKTISNKESQKITVNSHYINRYVYCQFFRGFVIDK
jgi:hypothetical protein